MADPEYRTIANVCGWTRIGSGSAYGHIFYKTAASEPASWTFETDSVLDGFSLAVVSAWSGVGSIEGAYSQAAASGSNANIADPGELVAGSAVLGLSTRYFSSYMGELQSATWTPTMTSRGTASDGDRDAIVTSVAIGSTFSPGTLYLDASMGIGQRGYVLLLEGAPEEEDEERDGSAKLILSASSSTAFESRSGNAGIVITPSSVKDEGAARSGSAGIVLSAASEIGERKCARAWRVYRSVHQVIMPTKTPAMYLRGLYWGLRVIHRPAQ